MAQFQFNAREVEPDQGRVGAIPAGWYKTMVAKTELKPTENGGGQYIAVMIQVLEGPYKGSNIFTNFNVINQSEKAVEIGRKQLSALCHAVDLLDMQDTDQLKNRPFFTRVKFVPAELKEDGTIKYEEKNEPNAYRHVNDQMAISKAAETAASKPAAGAPVARPAGVPPQQAPQQYAPPPQQAPVAYQPPPQQAPQQYAPPPAAAPQTQFQAPQQQAPQQFQPAPVQQVEGQPAWAAAPAQPWGAPPAAAQPQANAAPVMTPEQQAAFAATQSAAPPWGAPQ